MRYAPGSAPVGAGEDLHRAGDVEALHAVEEDDENGSLLSCVHPCGGAGDGRNDEYPTFPAIAAVPPCLGRSGAGARPGHLRFPPYRPVGNMRA